ncbi:MAG: sugar transferase [Acidimicrobiales bacterium]
MTTALLELPKTRGNVPPSGRARAPIAAGAINRFDARPAAMIVAAYVLLMPFLAGLPRGSIVPQLRPSEALQLFATVGAGALLVPALLRGESFHFRLRRSEWWLVAMAIAASVMPLLWLVARSEPVGADQILAAFPFVKFLALYVLVRAAVCSSGDARAVFVAATTAGVVVAVVAIAQALGVVPVINVLSQYYNNGDAVIIDAGRGSATVGSSIAAGTYLAVGATAGLSMAFATRGRLWLATAAVLAAGSLASGQASIALGLVFALLIVGWLHGQARLLVAWGVPALLLGVAALWPIVAARLDAIDQGSGLPSSWVVRWVNVTELYWPRLADGGWLLGVSPDATQVPPDVWRDIVYLESGYLWLLWVGGIPLLVAAVLFLWTAYHDLGAARASGSSSTTDGLATAGQSAVAMFAVLSLLDPHLTLRASADLFFVLLASAAATVPFARSQPAPHRRWRSLLESGPASSRDIDGEARVRFGEAPPGSMPQLSTQDVELTLRFDVVGCEGPGTHTDVVFIRLGAALHAVVSEPAGATSPASPEKALLWRGVARCAASLRVDSLTFVDDGQRVTVGRREIKRAAGLAERLEAARALRRPSSIAGRSSEPLGRHHVASLPVRLETVRRPPRWKRATDLVLATAATVTLAPVAAVCAVLVSRSGPGPVIFRQVRVGAGGLPFQMWKFRTMHIGNDDAAKRIQNKQELLGLASGEKDIDDERVTSVGRWLRRLSLDELPQLTNVVRGEMSLVGPRPSLLWEVELFAPPSRRRLTVNPGVTGLWQTSGRGDLSMPEMLELDLAYVDSASASVDLRCLAATARSVIDGEGAA